MKKIFCICLCMAMLLSLGVVFASAYPGYYCGGSEENFAPVGDIEIIWDTEASDKLRLDGDMRDWEAAGYSSVLITPNNMISWVGGSDENQAGGVPEGWEILAYFVADPDCLYIGFHVTDPEVFLVKKANDYTSADSLQMSFDFDRALGKFIEEDPDLFPSAQCVFYSFGPMGETATPIQMMRQNSDGNDGIVCEANGAGVKGSTALTENGWCAEFSFTWDQLYSDFERKSYAYNYECSVAEGDPLEVGCALYYLNNATVDGSKTLNWAAGTLKGQEAGATPQVTWGPSDNGMRLFLEYKPDRVFNCEGINVPSAEETSVPETEAPETEKGGDVIYEGVIEYSTFIYSGDITGEWYTFVMGNGSIVNGEFCTFVMGNGSASLRPNPNDPPSNGGQDGMIVINCASTLTPAVTLVVLSGALVSAWALKKKRNRQDD